MQTVWGILNYLPVLIIGLMYYLLFVRLPRWLRGLRRPKSDQGSAEVKSAAAQPPAAAAETPAAPRRRTLPTVSELDASAAPAAAPTSAASPARPSAASPAAELIEESHSVILRRQVPVREGEAARSWLGGLPSMPDGIEWPRSISSEYPDQGERPLHFAAQICCADLPAQLWGGLGPRDGWLLLFLDPNQGSPEGADSFRIIHTAELGTPRPAPFDLGPVHDGNYTGPDYRYLLPGTPVPNTWRQWPVDLVAVPNAAREEEGRVLVAPDDLAVQLYPGQNVAGDEARMPQTRPLTYGQVLYALHDLRRSLDINVPPVTLKGEVAAMLQSESGFADLLADLTANAEKANGELQRVHQEAKDEPDAEKRAEAIAKAEARVRYCAEPLAWLQAMGSAQNLVQHYEGVHLAQTAWQDNLRKQVDAVINAIGQLDLDTPLTQLDWEELQASFEGRDFADWRLHHQTWLPERHPISLQKHIRSSALKPPQGMAELLADSYLDPALRPLIPGDVLAGAEPVWRKLRSNRPHRMGGYHDGVQSDAVIGPKKDLLLFQLASDDAMNWCWGDVGAYYFWIKPRHLAAGDFSGVEVWLECH